MMRRWQSCCVQGGPMRGQAVGKRRARHVRGVENPGRWRQGPLAWRKRCRALRAAALLAGGLSSVAAFAGMPAFPLRASPQVYWSEPVSAQIWGMPLHYVRFATHWPLEKMAAELSRDAARFQVFTRLPGRLMLSGQTADQHWVAQLTADGRGSRGMVSVWRTQSAGALEGKGVLADLFQPSALWRTLLHVRQSHEGRTMEQAVYHGTAALPALLADVSRRLRQAGWEPAEPTDPTWQTWKRSHQRLRWQHRSQAGQVMIFMHYSE